MMRYWALMLVRAHVARARAESRPETPLHLLLLPQLLEYLAEKYIGGADALVGEDGLPRVELGLLVVTLVPCRGCPRYELPDWLDSQVDAHELP